MKHSVLVLGRFLLSRSFMAALGTSFLLSTSSVNTLPSTSHARNTRGNILLANVLPPSLIIFQIQFLSLVGREGERHEYKCVCANSV